MFQRRYSVTLVFSGHKSLLSLPLLPHSRELTVQEGGKYRASIPFPVLSVERGKSGDLYCATQGLWLLGCPMQVWSGTLYDSASCKNAQQSCSSVLEDIKCGRALEIPAHLHAAGTCLQHLQVSVCILHLWALSRRAITKGVLLQGNKLIALPLSWSCFRQL